MLLRLRSSSSLGSLIHRAEGAPREFLIPCGFVGGARFLIGRPQGFLIPFCLAWLVRSLIPSLARYEPLDTREDGA